MGEPVSVSRQLSKVLYGPGALLTSTEVTPYTIPQVELFAVGANKKVTISTVNNFNKVVDLKDFVVDKDGHALHNVCDGSDRFLNGYITLEHKSTAALAMPVYIPADANSLTFGVEFLMGEPGSMLEVFINNVPVYYTTSDRMLGEGFQLIPWIDVAAHAGKKVTVTLRLSNPNPGTQGKIRIDDMLVAKIEDYKPFPWPMFLPAITHGVKQP